MPCWAATASSCALLPASLVSAADKHASDACSDAKATLNLLLKLLGPFLVVVACLLLPPVITAQIL